MANGDLVSIYAQIQLVHTTAAVYLAIHCLPMAPVVMVST